MSERMNYLELSSSVDIEEGFVDFCQSLRNTVISHENGLKLEWPRSLEGSQRILDVW